MAMEFLTPGMQPAQCWLVRSGCPINGSMKEVKSSGDPVALTWMNSIWYNAVLTRGLQEFQKTSTVCGLPIVCNFLVFGSCHVLNYFFSRTIKIAANGGKKISCPLHECVFQYMT